MEPSDVRDTSAFLLPDAGCTTVFISYAFAGFFGLCAYGQLLSFLDKPPPYARMTI